MHLLPKSNPLIINLATDALKLPDVISKLSASGFSGYVSFVFQSTTVLLVFVSGKLASVLLEENNGNRQTGFEALLALAHLMVTSGGGAVNAYKMSNDLAMGIHALLQGDILYKAQETKPIEIKSVLANIKSDKLNGCLRIYTDERATLIFYKGGNPVGFFNDCSQDIETSSNESQKIAGLPGARIDLFSTHGVEQLMDQDLLEIVNIQSIWDTTVASRQPETATATSPTTTASTVSATPTTTTASTIAHEEKTKVIPISPAQREEQIKEIVTKYIGKVGRGIVDKELATLGGNVCLSDTTHIVTFTAGIERSAKLLISATNIKLMLNEFSQVFAAGRSES